MYFIFSKVLAFLINPFFICLLSFMCWYFLKRKPWKKIFLGVTIGLLFLFTNPFLTSLCSRAWETSGVILPEDKSYDVGILLGGMGKYNPEFKRPGLNSDGDRIWQTLDLYHRKKIDKILISTFNGSLIKTASNEAQMFRNQLIAWGIPPKDILIEDKSRNTYENAKFTKELLSQSYPHLRSMLLITSTLHMKRAAACFEKQGLPVQVYPTCLAGEGPITYTDYFVPDGSNFESWRQLLKEMVGWLTYKVLGYA